MQELVPSLLPSLGLLNPLAAQEISQLAQQLTARASVRCTAPNYLPKVGQLAAGLWVNVAHGSKGLASIPLSAEILASHISQEPAPLDADLLARLQP